MTAVAPSPVETDEAAIRGLYQQLLDAWGRGDGSAYGALFTVEADYVGFDGSHTVGRRAIAESHQRLFDTWLKGTRLTGRIEAVRMLGRILRRTKVQWMLHVLAEKVVRR